MFFVILKKKILHRIILRENLINEQNKQKNDLIEIILFFFIRKYEVVSNPKKIVLKFFFDLLKKYGNHKIIKAQAQFF